MTIEFRPGGSQRSECFLLPDICRSAAKSKHNKLFPESLSGVPGVQPRGI
jgi:hypothetical protein